MSDLLTTTETPYSGLLVALVLLVTAGWAAYTYSKSRRSERARWLHDVFTDVYFSDRFQTVKNVLEYRYDDDFAELLERRMNDRHVPITVEQEAVLDQLDNFLNYIEHVLGLEQRGLMSRRERLVIFDYWPNIIQIADRFSALRRYIAMSGYELISAELALENVDYLCAYGSLRKGLSPEHQPDFDRYLEHIGTVRVSGHLYLVPDGSYDYPGLILDPPEEGRILHPQRRSPTQRQRLAERLERAVVADLYRVQDAAVFQELDAWEGFDATDYERSPYIRRLCRMLEPTVDAWVYVGNHAQREDLPGVRDWVEWTQHQPLEGNADGSP